MCVYTFAKHNLISAKQIEVGSEGHDLRVEA